jgi:hypothetical protein
VTFEISDEQRRSFATDGYIVMPGLVPRSNVDEALRAINHWLGEHVGSETHEPREDAAIHGLLRGTRAIEAATSLVGAPLVTWGLPQIALRFPVRKTDGEEHGPTHIDGVPVPGTGLPVGEKRLFGFTVLAGIFLSDVVEPGQGNFTAWPGTHQQVADWLREHGAELDDPDELLNTTLPQIAETQGPGVPVIARAGDVLLAHYLLLHAIGTNESPHIRYAVFFRLERDGHDAFGDRAYTDVWAEWDAMATESAT